MSKINAGSLTFLEIAKRIEASSNQKKIVCSSFQLCEVKLLQMIGRIRKQELRMPLSLFAANKMLNFMCY